MDTTTSTAAAAVSTDNAGSKILLGTAPDSWGVWFDRDPHQVEWQQYLDEAAQAGYVWTELGPYGFLPTDPSQLQDELGQRGLRLSGGAVFAGLHNGPEALQKGLEECREECRLLTALGAKHLVLLPPQYTDMHTGATTEPGHLEPEQWEHLTTGMDTLGKALKEEFDVQLVFHPHVDSHVGHPGPHRAAAREHRPAVRQSSASTPVTSPTAAATTWRSSASTPSG